MSIHKQRAMLNRYGTKEMKAYQEGYDKIDWHKKELIKINKLINFIISKLYARTSGKTK